MRSCLTGNGCTRKPRAGAHRAERIRNSIGGSCKKIKDKEPGSSQNCSFLTFTGGYKRIIRGLAPPGARTVCLMDTRPASGLEGLVRALRWSLDVYDHL